MSKKTGPTNPYLRKLAENLRIKSRELNAPIWAVIAEKLSKPTRQRIEVNLSDIERHTSDGETIIVPGVVLAAGVLSKKISVAAWKFSPAAEEKIKSAAGECLTIENLLEKNPKGSNVKIIS
ncbi:MAG: 50S ribosomal protein L18e [Candidatus Aenigmarchaeota archaeon]|nr:50S ribosomal protein L18e [Candidatus Aenigmarchaeota archaeon]